MMTIRKRFERGGAPNTESRSRFSLFCLCVILSVLYLKFNSVPRAKSKTIVHHPQRDSNCESEFLRTQSVATECLKMELAFLAAAEVPWTGHGVVRGPLFAAAVLPAEFYDFASLY